MGVVGGAAAMRTITRCPGCHTVFIVHREQLEAREGRVRCGACGTVFDARVSLELLEGGEPESEPAPAPRGPTKEELFEETQPILLDMGPLPEGDGLDADAAPTSPQDREADQSTLVMPRSPLAARSDLLAGDEAEKEPLFAEEHPAELAPTSGTVGSPIGTTAILIETAPGETASEDAQGAAADAGDGSAQPSPPSEGRASSDSAPAVTAPEHDAGGTLPSSAVVFRPAPAEASRPDFDAERRGQRRLARTWGLACIPVALLLAIQIALHWRAELASAAPGLRGLLSGLCAPFGCEVGLPQHAEMLALEGANLEADPGGFLTLYATLRNRARYEQALPAIELTLTDPRDQPVARRLLTPRDYAPARQEGIPAGGELAITVAIDATATKAAGFRAEAVYQ